MFETVPSSDLGIIYFCVIWNLSHLIHLENNTKTCGVWCSLLLGVRCLWRNTAMLNHVSNPTFFLAQCISLYTHSPSGVQRSRGARGDCLIVCPLRNSGFEHRTVAWNFSKGSLCVCAEELDIIKLTKTPLIYSVSRFNLGGLGAWFGETKPVLPLCCYGNVLDFMIKITEDSQSNTRLQTQTYTQWKCPQNAFQCQP